MANASPFDSLSSGTTDNPATENDSPQSRTPISDNLSTPETPTSEHLHIDNLNTGAESPRSEWITEPEDRLDPIKAVQRYHAAFFGQLESEKERLLSKIPFQSKVAIKIIKKKL